MNPPTALMFRSPTLTRIALARAVAPLGKTEVSYAGFNFVTLGSLIDYCRAKLKAADNDIVRQMSHLDDINKSQQMLSNLRQALPPDKAAQSALAEAEMELARRKHWLQQGYRVDDSTGRIHELTQTDRNECKQRIAELEKKLPALQSAVNGFDQQIDAVCQHLEAIDQPEAAQAIRRAAQEYKNAPDNKEVRERFLKTIEAQSACISASREMAMVKLQSLVSQRGTMLQMITNMMSSLNDSAKAIAANCR